MSESKHHRRGGKFAGSHSTYTEISCKLADAANDLPEVTKISSGFIRSGLKSVNGQRRVKLVAKNTHCILATVRDNITCHEVWIYVSNMAAAMTNLADKIKSLGIEVSV